MVGFRARLRPPAKLHVPTGTRHQLELLGPGGGSAFGGIAVDSHGHIATYWGGGLGMAEGTGVSGGVQLAGSNGNSVCSLGGPFTNVSGTAGYELAGTGDYFFGAGDAPGGLVQGRGSNPWGRRWRCRISARDRN